MRPHVHGWTKRSTRPPTPTRHRGSDVEEKARRPRSPGAVSDDVLHAPIYDPAMRYGITIDVSASIAGVIEEVRTLRDAEFDFVATSQIFGYDALTLLAVVGAAVPDIELTTAVVPTYPRHPIMLAAQALTVQAATGGRLTLGIGLSHQVVIEGMFGYSFDKPARHMREYLQALMPLLRGEAG